MSLVVERSSTAVSSMGVLLLGMACEGLLGGPLLKGSACRTGTPEGKTGVKEMNNNKDIGGFQSNPVGGLTEVGTWGQDAACDKDRRR